METMLNDHVNNLYPLDKLKNIAKTITDDFLIELKDMITGKEMYSEINYFTCQADLNDEPFVKSFWLLSGLWKYLNINSNFIRASFEAVAEPFRTLKELAESEQIDQLI